MSRHEPEVPRLPDPTPPIKDELAELRLRLAEADRVIRRQRAEIEALRGDLAESRAVAATVGATSPAWEPRP